LGSLGKAGFGIPILSSYFILLFPPVVSFLFFVSVNALGAVLGCGFSVNRAVREWGNRKTWNLLGAVLGVGLIVVGCVLGGVSHLETGLAAVGGGQYVQYSVTRRPFNYDGWAFLFFEIIVLAIVVLRTSRKRRA